MQPLARLIVSLTLAAGCAAAVAADRAAEPARLSSEVQARQAAIDAAAREKEVVVPAAPAVAAKPTKADRAANRKLLAAVRRAVVRDKTLSMAAHNVKMAANAGVITLTGDVRNAAEKAKVEAVAKNVVGVSSLDSQLTFKTVAVAKPAKAAPAVRENTRAEARTEARTKAEKTR